MFRNIWFFITHLTKTIHLRVYRSKGELVHVDTLSLSEVVKMARSKAWKDYTFELTFEIKP